VTIPGNGQSDDHLNIKDLQGDAAGHIYAVIKTSLNDIPGHLSTDPQIVVIGRDPTTRSWSRATFGTIADCHTRPVLVLDSANSLVHVYATAPPSGCPFSGARAGVCGRCCGGVLTWWWAMCRRSDAGARGDPVAEFVHRSGLRPGEQVNFQHATLGGRRFAEGRHSPTFALFKGRPWLFLGCTSPLLVWSASGGATCSLRRTSCERLEGRTARWLRGVVSPARVSSLCR
jgi:hypothetical protein